jgi:hypothetical protein
MDGVSLADACSIHDKRERDQSDCSSLLPIACPENFLQSLNRHARAADDEGWQCVAEIAAISDKVRGFSSDLQVVSGPPPK